MLLACCVKCPSWCTWWAQAEHAIWFSTRRSWWWNPDKKSIGTNTKVNIHAAKILLCCNSFISCAKVIKVSKIWYSINTFCTFDNHIKNMGSRLTTQLHQTLCTRKKFSFFWWCKGINKIWNNKNISLKIENSLTFCQEYIHLLLKFVTSLYTLAKNIHILCIQKYKQTIPMYLSAETQRRGIPIDLDIPPHHFNMKDLVLYTVYTEFKETGRNFHFYLVTLLLVQ